jgi:hypothetical protein
MKLIKPRNISGEIMELIYEADEKMIFVSPYYNISEWLKLKNALKDLSKRNVHTEFYVRKGVMKSIDEVISNTGISPFEIPILHTKLYMNEKRAIISSMNLNYSSDNNSLDIAVETTDSEEYAQIESYYQRNIKIHALQEVQITKTQANQQNWKEILDYRLEQVLKRDVFIRQVKDSLQINTANRYEAFIANEKTNMLRISAILSFKEFQYALQHSEFFQKAKMKIELIEGSNNYYSTAWGTLEGLKSRSINELEKREEEEIIDSLYQFIIRIEELKKIVRR